MRSNVKAWAWESCGVLRSLKLGSPTKWDRGAANGAWTLRVGVFTYNDGKPRRARRAGRAR